MEPNALSFIESKISEKGGLSSTSVLYSEYDEHADYSEYQEFIYHE